MSRLWGLVRFLRDDSSARLVWLAVGAVNVLLLLLAFAMEQDARRRILAFSIASILLVAALVLHWRRTRRVGHWRGSPKNRLETAWGVAAAFSLLVVVGTILMTGGIAAAAALDATQKIQVDYFAEVDPVDPGPYEILLPAFRHTESVQVVEGAGDAALVETEFGEAIRIRGEERVRVESTLEHRASRHGAAAYELTLVAPPLQEPPFGREGHYRVHVTGNVPLRVSMGFDVGYDCGTFEHRLTATVEPGWGTYEGRSDHPHGDFCGLDGLMFLSFAVIVLPLMMVLPVFVIGVFVLTGTTVWYFLRKKDGPGALADGEPPDP